MWTQKMYKSLNDMYYKALVDNDTVLVYQISSALSYLRRRKSRNRRRAQHSSSRG